MLLRGLDSAYKVEMIERAQKTGLLGTRILFPEAVGEVELVSALRDGDVGLLSYTPTGKNYTHCCPNKMSQYMAAGLPILANATTFVKSVIEELRSGIVADFSRRKDLIASVARLLEDREARKSMGRRGNEYFRNSFHWEKRSRAFYRELETATFDQPEQAFELFPTASQEALYNKKIVSLKSQAKVAARRAIVGALECAAIIAPSPLRRWGKRRLAAWPRVRRVLGFGELDVGK